MDGMTTDKRVVVIDATNRQALRRRLEKRIINRLVYKCLK